MKLIHHHYLHLNPTLERALLEFLTAFPQGDRIMAALDDLKANVTKNTDAVASAVTLLGNLKTALDAAIASGDMGQVQALSDQIGKNDADLASAVAANTPAGPTTPVAA